MTLRERYYNDPVFHTLVDTMVSYMYQCRTTPGEMREVVMLASIIYEEQRRRGKDETGEWICEACEPPSDPRKKEKCKVLDCRYHGPLPVWHWWKEKGGKFDS